MVHIADCPVKNPLLSVQESTSPVLPVLDSLISDRCWKTGASPGESLQGGQGTGAPILWGQPEKPELQPGKSKAGVSGRRGLTVVFHSCEKVTNKIDSQQCMVWGQEANSISWNEAFRSSKRETLFYPEEGRAVEQDAQSLCSHCAWGFTKPIWIKTWEPSTA